MLLSLMKGQPEFPRLVEKQQGLSTHMDGVRSLLIQAFPLRVIVWIFVLYCVIGFRRKLEEPSSQLLWRDIHGRDEDLFFGHS